MKRIKPTRLGKPIKEKFNPKRRDPNEIFYGKKPGMSPLAEQPDLAMYKEKYEGKKFTWFWDLEDNRHLYAGEPLEMELYRLALGIAFEDKEAANRDEKRKQLREKIKGYFKADDLLHNMELNTYLMSYFCTYDSPRTFFKREPIPDNVGIMIYQNVDTEEDLKIFMGDIKLFNAWLDIRRKTNQSILKALEADPHDLLGYPPEN